MATLAVGTAIQDQIQNASLISPPSTRRKRAYTEDNPHSPSPSTSSSLSNQLKEPCQVKSKNRRRKRRHVYTRSKWFENMTAEELAEYERVESERAERRREQLLAKGVPMAPYNTGQFLKEDRLSREAETHHSDEIRQGEEIYNEFRHKSENAEDTGDSASTGSFDREFEMALHDMRYEKLSEMSKEQLIDLIMDVEAKYEEQSLENGTLRIKLAKCQKNNKMLQELAKTTVGVRRDSTKESGHESN